MNSQNRINYIRYESNTLSKDTQNILDYTIFFNYLDGEIANDKLEKFMSDFTQLNAKRKEAKYLFSLQLFVNYGIILYRYIKVLTLLESFSDLIDVEEVADFIRHQLFDYYNNFIDYLSNVKWLPPSLLKLYHNLFLSFVKRRNYKRFRQLYIYWFNHLLKYIFGNSLEEMEISKIVNKNYEDSFIKKSSNIQREYDIFLLLYLLQSINILFFSLEFKKLLRVLFVLLKQVKYSSSFIIVSVGLNYDVQLRLFKDLNLHLNLLRYNHIFLSKFIMIDT